jgi:alkylated DNA nucleotide flippase Atl1
MRHGDPENGPWCRVCNTYGHTLACPVAQEEEARMVAEGWCPTHPCEGKLGGRECPSCKRDDEAESANR